MKKSFHFSVLSDKVCSVKGCTTKLKQRLVDEKPTVKKCFKCFKQESLRKRLTNPNFNL